ncbi:MAG: enoyl-[acyl-carrier-protein] reductase FabI [Pelagibacteraceae bacterium]|nr:enoyl-[acyl-carrier-protein] reductase FabI [Pelagibacteraceae bacterium]PPR47301.1 MAG: Enoyl-[acyl-carrier-protein] reductase [NADH] FabI [Alphaproteobacteria bacterium MarineAlpha5_Bin9]
MLMNNKKGLIMGVANERSIAWGIAKSIFDKGGELAFTYQGEALKKRVEPLASSLNSNLVIPCDVTDSESMKKTFNILKEKWDKIDFLVHAIAYADKNELKGKYYKTSNENFNKSMHISCYSFTEACRLAEPLMKDGGSIISLTYYGAEQVMPHYNVMGVAKAALETSIKYLAVDLGEKNIRVNAISAGPIKTLAASGIGDFRFILRWNELNSPLKRNITLDDIGNSALYLLSDLGKAVTGEIHHVDCGYHTVGMLAVDEAGPVSELLQEFENKNK